MTDCKRIWTDERQIASKNKLVFNKTSLISERYWTWPKSYKNKSLYPGARAQKRQKLFFCCASRLGRERSGRRYLNKGRRRWEIRRREGEAEKAACPRNNITPSVCVQEKEQANWPATGRAQVHDDITKPFLNMHATTATNNFFLVFEFLWGPLFFQSQLMLKLGTCRGTLHHFLLFQ